MLCLTLPCLAVGLGACGSDPYPGEPEGTVHVALNGGIKTTDPALADDTIAGTVVSNVYDQLYTYHHLKREPVELVPCLAAALPKVSDDGLTWTIPLKRGVRFADDPCFTATGGKGREVVADDFVYSIKRLMDTRLNSPGSVFFAGKLAGIDAFAASTETAAAAAQEEAALRGQVTYPGIEGLEALDTHTVQLRLTQPSEELMWTLAMNYASVVPREAVQHYGILFPWHPVGSGPYRLTHIEPERIAIFDRNETYREVRFPSEGDRGDAELGLLQDAGKRTPFAPRVVATVFKQDQPRWLYFQRGYLDFTGIPKDNFGSAIDTTTRELAEPLAERGIRLRKNPAVEIIYDCFNMEDPVVGAPAGDKGRAIRRAISLATNIDWEIEYLRNGRGSPVHAPLLPDFPEFDPRIQEPVEAAPGGEPRGDLGTRPQDLGRRGLSRRQGHPRPAAGSAGGHDESAVLPGIRARLP